MSGMFQELYLPWGYDLALLGIALVYLLNGLFGVELWRFAVMGVSACRLLTVLVVVANFAMSLPVSLYNIYCKYTPVNQLKYGLLDGAAPLLSVVLLALFSTVWMFYSTNNIAQMVRIFHIISHKVGSFYLSRISDQKLIWTND